MAAEDWFNDESWDGFFCDGPPGARHRPPPRPSGDANTWVTGQGQAMRFRDMTDLHLLNTIAYVERKFRDLQDTFRRGALDINLLYPQHAGLVAEARRRRLIPKGRENEMVTE